MMKQSTKNLQEIMMRRVDPARDEEGNSVWDAAEVYPGLFVGSLRAARDLDNLAAQNIAAVLTVAGQLSVDLPSEIYHMTINIADHAACDVLEIIPGALQFIDGVLVLGPDAGRKSVLVHCASGISRSVSVCCAWLMARQGLTYEAALERVQQNRPLARPNFGFHAQLKTLSAKATSMPFEDALVAAREEYKQSLGTQTVVDVVLEQRREANLLHQEADEVENELMGVELRNCQPEQIQVWRERLQHVLTALDAIENVQSTPKETVEGGGVSMGMGVTSVFAAVRAVEDRPAAIIRKGARSKAQRLLDSLP